VTEVDRLGWAVTVPLRAGEHVLGVRAGSAALAALLRELFVDRLVPDASPPANLSVHLAPPATGGNQDLHRLYVTYSRMLRTRSVIRTVDALWHELDIRDVEVARQRLQLSATVVVHEGRAHVLPGHMRRRVVDDQRRWQADGFQLVDRRLVDLDPGAGTVTIPVSGLSDAHEAIRNRIGELGVDHRADALRPLGVLPIAGWVLPEGTLASRVVEAAGQVVDRPAHDGVALIRGLAELLAGLSPLTAATADEVRTRLTAG
jgi:hypothetical protein